MRVLLFFLQMTIVLSWIKIHYNIDLKEIFNGKLSFNQTITTQTFLTTPLPKETYSNYYSQNILGESVLDLSNIPPKKQLNIWIESAFHQEMLNAFPQLEDMVYVVHEKIINSDNFSEALIEYLENTHADYISGELNFTQFQEKIKKPKF